MNSRHTSPKIKTTNNMLDVINILNEQALAIELLHLSIEELKQKIKWLEEDEVEVIDEFADEEFDEDITDWALELDNRRYYKHSTDPEPTEDE